ncbi:MAG TPA: hypothetical protein VN030_14200 [Cellvibrio sp.]|nr:hypothetical protein [Cellvibrio sp.]
MDYQTLDTIADAYIPLLLLIALLTMAIRSAKNKSTIAANLQILGSLLLLCAGAYGLMFIDQRLGLWPSVGLDYSTHTAIAVVLVYVLLLLFPGARLFTGASLAIYAGLMIYQGYHSLSDILSTGIVIIGSILLLNLLQKRHA